MSEAGGVRRVFVRAGRGEGYAIEIGAGLLDGVGRLVRESFDAPPRRVALVSNRRVFGLYGAKAVGSLRGSGFEVRHWLMGDGERHKSLRTLERALRFLSESGLERGDAVVALGGGVVGDLAGFAAAVYLRGVAFVQAPTTLLAQIDSSVGGKTGVNTREGKNLVGAFHRPRAVVVDVECLRTLPRRELTAGWCEAVKQGAVGDRKLFLQTQKFLAGEKGKAGGVVVDEGQAVELSRLIAAQCAFKAKIVAGDEREDVSRTDARSRRILNFGHTVGHALEAVTRYRRFRHGEAVGYGMLAAAEISEKLGLLGRTELECLRAAVRSAGRLPRASDLDAETVRLAIRSDKKSSGGSVRWVLLETIGRARVVDGRDIPVRAVRSSIRAALGGPQ